MSNIPGDVPLSLRFAPSDPQEICRPRTETDASDDKQVAWTAAQASDSGSDQVHRHPTSTPASDHGVAPTPTPDSSSNPVLISKLNAVSQLSVSPVSLPRRSIENPRESHWESHGPDAVTVPQQAAADQPLPDKFIAIHLNTRGLATDDRVVELLGELQNLPWDVITVNETKRDIKE